MTESTSLEAFESTLKETVTAKRLSVSTVKEVTNLAMKNMENDTQLVSILYRTHKTLTPARKVHSLYVFDSLSRAARHQVDKQGLSAKLNSEHGNSATFLLKVEGVLDGLIQDMAATGPETKEKAKKILDIWTKSNTFPSAVLSRLHKLVKDSTEKDSDKVTNEPASIATVDPRPQSHNQTIATQPPPTQATIPSAPNTNGMQATLLALLSQAANAVAASSGQITTNIPTAIPTSQPATTEPFALLQQLTQTAHAGNIPSPQPIPVPVSLVPSAPPNAVPPVATPVGGHSQPPPYYRDDRNGFTHKEPQYDRYGPGPDRGRENFDDRRDPRGPHRGGYRNDFRGDFRGDHRGSFRGGFRGRGRGRRDDHDRRNDMHGDQNWGPPTRHRSGRSRSPSHARYQQEGSARADSPPQITPVFRMPDASESAQPAQEDGKDEFGRDLRPPSLEREEGHPTQSDQASRQSSVQYETHTPSSPSNPYNESITAAPLPAPIPTITDSTPPNPAGSLSPTSPAGTRGLDSFDLLAFDMTTPASWEALANTWKATHGYMPQQTELMQYILAVNNNAQGNLYPQNQYETPQNERWPTQEQEQHGQGRGWGNRGWRGRERGRGRARGRGRGGYSYGNGNGNGNGNGGEGYGEQETDALTLTGGDDSSYATHWQNPPAGQPDHGHYTGTNPNPPPTGGLRSSGRMQKIGDKWVFVKGDAPGQ